MSSNDFETRRRARVEARREAAVRRNRTSAEVNSLRITAITLAIENGNEPATLSLIVCRVRRFLDWNPPAWLIRLAVHSPYFELTDRGWVWSGKWHYSQQQLF